MTYAFAQKPASRWDARERQQEQRISAAEQGFAPPESGERRKSTDVTPVRFWSAAMTANAPRFMNVYAAP